MAFAVIETGGKQYRVSLGSVLTLERLEVPAGENISFEKVLLYQDSKDPVIGKPYVEGAIVKAEVLQQLRGPKIRVSTYKSKKRQRRTLGHRQELTQVKVVEMRLASEKVTPKSASKSKVKAEVTDTSVLENLNKPQDENI
jgi:large subunit ribosomal protein L21